MAIFVSSILLFIIDRITKAFALKMSSKIVISPFLTISLTRNYGISFGLFSGYSGIIFWVTLIACILLVFYSIFLKQGSPLFKIGIGLFIGGAISNLFDRAIYSFVIDFISIGIGNLRWPTFNLADCGIVTGAMLIILRKNLTSKVKGSNNLFIF
ncbi:MAG: signal peptidase II [bacterium]